MNEPRYYGSMPPASVEVGEDGSVLGHTSYLQYRELAEQLTRDLTGVFSPGWMDRGAPSWTARFLHGSPAQNAQVGSEKTVKGKA